MPVNYPTGVGIVLYGGDGNDLDPVAAVHGVQQRLEIRANTRGENRDPHAARSPGEAQTSQHVVPPTATEGSPK